MEHTTETPAVSLAEEIVEAPKVQTQEKIICCLKEDQSEFSEERRLNVLVVTQGYAPLPSMPQEHIQERTVEENDVLVPHMMEKTIGVAKNIPQERVQSYTVEHIIDAPVSLIWKETGEVMQLIPQETNF